ncbi:DUF502 domain-containing protein [Anianabacter salinae]|uniref:DUF502 domain-containing protein n=1 Tax=Anianabacter salinae TaxID=2851023 RepID=UPI00225E6580|nr:DUF502 domain-containing protein [Anianabacter salinae]MBV0912144.1 DUF502 domain-containing protein [Anianabacter salinae]
MTKSDPTPSAEPKRRPSWLLRLRGNFLTGLVVIAPIGLTVWLVWTVIGWVDGFVLPLVPGPYKPDNIIMTLFGVDYPLNIRGIGVVVFLLFTLLIGWLAKGLIGRSLLRWGEHLVDRMPIVRSVYNALKQIAETVFSQAEASFEKACLIEYPRPGLWAVAFVSTTAKGEVLEKLPEDDQVMTVFLPTTPNPTSGFLLFVPKRDVIELDMTIEDAAKLVISAGLVYPTGTAPAIPTADLPPKLREKISA